MAEPTSGSPAPLSGKAAALTGPVKSFAIGLGCDLADAGRLVYAKGLSLDDPAARTLIGVGCKLCERKECPQRAFPPVARGFAVDETVASFAPYSTV
ncbi:MAG: short-chain fatty acyl-CoA regulator family protein [Rhizobium sp.]|nr:short-chain fatty acyl-CoA regulator family protein [Rhizobium sp.]